MHFGAFCFVYVTLEFLFVFVPVFFSCVCIFSMYNGFVLTQNLFEVEHVFVFLLRIMCLCVHFSSLQSQLHPFVVFMFVLVLVFIFVFGLMF